MLFVALQILNRRRAMCRRMGKVQLWAALCYSLAKLQEHSSYLTEVGGPFFRTFNGSHTIARSTQGYRKQKLAEVETLSDRAGASFGEESIRQVVCSLGDGPQASRAVSKDNREPIIEFTAMTNQQTGKKRRPLSERA